MQNLFSSLKKKKTPCYKKTFVKLVQVKEATLTVSVTIATEETLSYSTDMPHMNFRMSTIFLLTMI